MARPKSQTVTLAGSRDLADNCRACPCRLATYACHKLFATSGKLRGTLAMRLTSLLLLVAIVGGAGYVLVFKRDWLFKKVQEGTELAQGYSAAGTPQE